MCLHGGSTGIGSCVVGIVAPMSFQFFALHLCPTLVIALDLYISTAFVRVKVGFVSCSVFPPTDSPILAWYVEFRGHRSHVWELCWECDWSSLRGSVGMLSSASWTSAWGRTYRSVVHSRMWGEGCGEPLCRYCNGVFQGLTWWMRSRTHHTELGQGCLLQPFWVCEAKECCKCVGIEVTIIMIIKPSCGDTPRPHFSLRRLWTRLLSMCIFGIPSLKLQPLNIPMHRW